MLHPPVMSKSPIGSLEIIGIKTRAWKSSVRATCSWKSLAFGGRLWSPAKGPHVFPAKRQVFRENLKALLRFIKEILFGTMMLKIKSLSKALEDTPEKSIGGDLSEIPPSVFR